MKEKKIKNNILTIMKKECSRIFSDKRLFFTAVVMPGLLIGVMYFLMGNLMGQMFEVTDDYIYEVNAVDMPDSVRGLLPPELGINIIDIERSKAEETRQRIENRDTDLLIVFPPDFDALVKDYEVTSTAPAPNIEVWSNSARSESSAAQSLVTGILGAYHYSLAHKFSVNAPSEDAEQGDYELATDADIFAMVLGFMIPMMLIMFLYSGCMSLAPESIAGEKERGTLGGMLVTPTKRSDMAFAKIFSISIFGLMSAVVSMVAMILSLPSMMQMDVSMADFYSVKEYALLFVVVVTTALVFVSLLSLLSAYAKSVKEATAYANPILLVVVLCGLASTILGGVPSQIYFYLIPVFNSALCITSVINFEVNALNIALTAGVNVLFALICAGALAKMFNSEKIVFDK
jgi:sodium transport system permease protein